MGRLRLKHGKGQTPVIGSPESSPLVLEIIYGYYMHDIIKSLQLWCEDGHVYELQTAAQGRKLLVPNR